MRRRLIWLVTTGVLASLVSVVTASDEGGKSRGLDAGAAISRGITFLQTDAARWKVEHKCSSCHHGPMTVWALTEAERQGYAVDRAFLAEAREWARGHLVGIDKPRDPRPGWNMVNTPALYLGAMAGTEQGIPVLTSAELNQVGEHIGNHLEDDGSLLTPATMSPPMPNNGPPPIFESREDLTLLAMLTLSAAANANSNEASAACAARKRAAKKKKGEEPPK